MAARLRKVVIVSPYFPPSNMTCGHRTRLLSAHLKEHGYDPLILTVEPAYYEEPLDDELSLLVPSDTRILRTRALPTRPLRLVGDIGIRSLFFHYRELRRLAETEKIELLYIPIPPNYSALLGPMLRRKYGIPYAIDYIDPWVYPITEQERGSWKARASHWLSRALEPIVLSQVSGISAVAESYYAGVLARHPQLQRLPTLGVPYGFNPMDHALAGRSERQSRILKEEHLSQHQVFVYAGAHLPRATQTVKALFRGLSLVREKNAQAVSRVKLLFVGTSSNGEIRKLANEANIADLVIVRESREPYLEVLTLLNRSHAVMILGSNEPHYTASKTFQALLSDRPVLAILHEQSPATTCLQGEAGVELITFRNSANEITREIANSFEKILTTPSDPPVRRSLQSIEEFSARKMSARIGAFFDRVLESEKDESINHGRPRNPRASQALRRH